MVKQANAKAQKLDKEALCPLVILELSADRCDMASV
jgi:hypothetical protein